MIITSLSILHIDLTIFFGSIRMKKNNKNAINKW